MPMAKVSPSDRNRPVVSYEARKGNVLTDFLFHAAHSAPGRVALVAHEQATGTRSVFTYKELDGLVWRVAAGLIDLGVRRGGVVACQLPNWWQFTVLHLACLRVGAVFNPLGLDVQGADLRAVLLHGDVSILVVPSVFQGVDYAAAARAQIGHLPRLQRLLVVGGTGRDSFEDHVLSRDWGGHEKAIALVAGRPLAGGDAVHLHYPGQPCAGQGAVLNTSNVLFAQVRGQVARSGLSEGEVIFMATSLVDQRGFLCGVMMPIFLGATVVLQDVWNAEDAIRIVAAERPTVAVGPLSALSDLIDAAGNRREGLASLAVVLVAADGFPGGHASRVGEALNARLVPVWAMGGSVDAGQLATG